MAFHEDTYVLDDPVAGAELADVIADEMGQLDAYRVTVDDEETPVWCYVDGERQQRTRDERVITASKWDDLPPAYNMMTLPDTVDVRVELDDPVDEFTVEYGFNGLGVYRRFVGGTDSPIESAIEQVYDRLEA